MCLIITAAAALLFFLLGIFRKKHGKTSGNEMSVSLMFSAAALMWCVDGIAAVLQGEQFFDFSTEDFLLGLIIVAVGAAVYAVLVLKKRFARSSKCLNEGE